MYQHLVPYLATCLVCLSVQLAALEASASETEPQPVPDLLQQLVDRLASELGIDATIETTVVAEDPLLVSVRRVPGRTDANVFVMSFDERFLDGLTAEELAAIVAHELGHVWIFTHHPYLQTERLANSVAMRAVSRDSLEKVYTKVWERSGAKGDLVSFLGQ